MMARPRASAALYNPISMGMLSKIAAFLGQASKKGIIVVYEPGLGRRMYRCEVKRGLFGFFTPWKVNVSLVKPIREMPDLVGERMMELLSKDSLTAAERTELDGILDSSGNVIIVR